MSDRKKQIFLEAIKKAKKESVMGKLANGDTDPMEPWSKKHAPLDEVNSQVLWRFIKAMGRDPRTISLNDRLNLARTDRFKKFSRDHMKLIQQQKEEVENVAEGLNEMDKSQPSHGRDGKVSHSTYGSRDKEGSDYFKGKESPVKPITAKQAAKDALDILKKQGVAEGKETVNEAGTGTLMSYIKAKGLNPLSMDGNQKNKYSQSSEFKLFKHRKMKAETSGMGERGDDWNEEKKPVKEAVDKKDTVTMDIPLLIRVLEFIREDVKTDMDLHRVVENLIDLRTDGILTMDHYDRAVNIKKLKEEVEKKNYAIVNKSSNKIHSIYRDLDTAKHAHRQIDKDIRHHFTVMATSKDIKSVKENIDVDDFIKHLRSKGLPAKRPMSKADSDAELRSRAEKIKNSERKKPEPYKNPYPLGGYDERSGRSYSEQVEQLDELKKQSDTQDMDSHITREDLRKWFSKTDPEGGWKRINSKGEAIGPCAREPGEPKPKCMSNEKRAKLSKKERAAAVAAKRKYDPVADRAGKGGKPVNVSNFGKGKISKEDLDEASSPAQQAAIAIAMKKAGKKPKNEEVVDEACWDTHKQVGMKKKGNKMVPDCVPKNEEVELIDEKNKPTNPKLWARAKSLARSKFDVYPSAYANGWASKWYKSKGGGWRATSEGVEVNEGIYGIEDSPMSATNSVKAMESKMAKEKSKSARMIKAIYKKKGLKKETMYDWEKSEKGGEKEPNAKIILKGGKTMTGKDRDTIEIDPVVRTKLNSANGTKPNL